VKELGLDPKQYKYLKSDDKSTTLQHKKGHTVTIVHSILSPKNQAILKALATTAPEPEGEQIKREGMAEGGQAGRKAHNEFQQESMEANYAVNAGLPCLNPNCKSHGKPHPNCRCYGYAEGGEVRHFCSYKKPHQPNCEYHKNDNYVTEAPGGYEEFGEKLAKGGDVLADTVEDKGVSVQGRDVRHANLEKQRGRPEHAAQAMDYAKDEAKGRKEFERIASKPKLKGLAKGGMPEHSSVSMMSCEQPFAEGGEPKKRVDINPAKTKEKEAFLRTPEGEKIMALHKKEVMDKIPKYAEGGGPGILDAAEDWLSKTASNAYHTLDQYRPETPAGQEAYHTPESEVKKVVNTQQEPVFGNAQGGVVPSSTGYCESGESRKMYSDQDEPVSQDDSAPTSDKSSLEDKYPNVVGFLRKVFPHLESEGKANSDPRENIPQISAQVPEQPRDQNAPTSQPTLQASTQSTEQTSQPQYGGELSTSYSPIPANPITPTQPAPPPIQPADYKTAVQAHMDMEDAAFKQDLVNGHIEPKTYNSLFANMKTPEKIGTLFGLLIGGAGAGLSHQPNALLGLMQKQIDNDLDAQKQSKTNAQNFLRLSLAHEMNQANIRNLDTETNIKAQAAARQRMNWAAFHSLVLNNNKNPIGSPQRQAGDAQLAMLYPQIANENFALSDRAAAAAALSRFGNQPQGQQNYQSAEQAFQQRQKMLELSGNTDLAKFEADRHVPGIRGQASKPVDPNIQDRVVRMNTLDNQLNNVLDAVHKYSGLRGNINPRIIGPMAVKAHEAAALYNQTLDGLGMTQGRMNWLGEQIPSDPQKFMERLKGSREKLEEVAKNNRMRRDMILSGPGGLGFPRQTINTGGPQPPQQIQSPMPSPTSSKSNRPIFQDPKTGKWKYK
jgi:hypothetical protein